MPKLQEVKGQFTITIPKDIVHTMGWEKGQRLGLMFNERGNIEIKEKKENEK
jgi:bifunctional DNA-binding transcriptional regulator/antitoxin component of YhaV-PrlF toxin-antitoxin module